MWYSADDPAERERRRWIKPNAYLWVCQDIHRFMRPDADRFFHPSHRGQTPWYEQPEYISPAMRVYAEKPAPPYRPDDPTARADAAAAEADRRALTEELEWRARAEEAERQAFEIELERLRRNNNALQALLHERRDALTRRQRALKAGFDPDQPRVPAGNPDGGQWTDAGGGSSAGASDGGINDPRVLPDATPNNEWIPGERYAQAANQNDRLVNKHILDDHVGKSDEELAERIRREQFRGRFFSAGRDRNGSFASIENARDLISQTIENNAETVARVTSGKSDRELLTWRFGYETGREAYLDEPNGEIRFRKTYDVGVVIAYDPTSKSGYRVISAYPRNFNPRIGR